MMRIFLTNLGKYNEGYLIGEWLGLPATATEIEALKERIGISDEPDANGVYYEEWFITDYETDIPGVKVGEYDNIDELNEMAEELESLDECDKLAVEAMLEEGFDFIEALSKATSGDYMLFSGCEDMEDVAREYAEETGLLNQIPEHLQNYFDFAAFGRDLSFEGQFVFVGSDCVEIL